MLLLTGFLGIFFGRKNLILVIICLELLLLAMTFQYLLFGWGIYGDLKALLIGFYLLAISACESAVGLALIIAYFKN